MKHALSKPQFELSFIIGKGRKKNKNAKYLMKYLGCLHYQLKVAQLPRSGNVTTLYW